MTSSVETNLVQTSSELLKSGFSSTVVSQSGGLFNNGHIAVCKDLVFGLSVWNGDEWVSLAEATDEEIDTVRGLIAKGGLFLWHKELEDATRRMA